MPIAVPRVGRAFRGRLRAPRGCLIRIPLKIDRHVLPSDSFKRRWADGDPVYDDRQPGPLGDTRVPVNEQRFEPDRARSDSWNRGAYLTNAPGHCGECHTPRNWLMIADESQHLGGGPHPGGKGRVPSLRGLVARGRYKDVADLTLALQFGETLGYDKLASGNMAEIQMNLARLAESDVRAISEYLLSLD